MKSKSVRIALLPALMLMSPMIGFAGGQHLIRVPSKDEAQDRSGITPAVQYGKGTGMTRNDGVRANAFREQTPAESQVVKDQTKPGHPNWSDTALRK
jgi:hypothetical protein